MLWPRGLQKGSRVWNPCSSRVVLRFSESGPENQPVSLQVGHQPKTMLARTLGAVFTDEATRKRLADESISDPSVWS